MRKILDRLLLCAALAVVPATISTVTIAQAPTPAPMPLMPPSVPPSHVVNLMTNDGAAALGAQWKVSDVKIVEVPAAAGLMPQYKTTYSIEPQAGVSGYDDSKWQSIEAKDLSARRSGGHVAFMWYRATLTIPEKIGAFETSGAQAVVTILVDDYAEVWVNGADAAQGRHSEPGHHPGIQHAEPGRARAVGEGRRQIPDRGVRHQRADLGLAGKRGLVP